MLTCKVHTHACTHSEYTHTQKGREGERREWERGGRGGRGEERERESTQLLVLPLKVQGVWCL